MKFPMEVNYNGIEIKIDLLESDHPLQFSVTSPVSMISGIDTRKMLSETKQIIDKYFLLTKDYISAYEHLAERVTDYCLIQCEDGDEIEVNLFRLVIGQFIEQQVERRTDIPSPVPKRNSK